MLDLGEAHTFADLLSAAHVAEKQFDGQVWYRGQSQYGWHLVPSAHRRHPLLESQFANHFRLRAPALVAECPDHKDYVSWLPLMQHYGLPTRLLDWTESLLVAAFFAIPEKSTGSNAAIWMIAPGKLNEQSIGHFIPFLADVRVEPFITAAFSATAIPVSNHTIAVLAPRTDRRMAAQLGNYTIHGDRTPLNTHPAAANFLARVLIPTTARNTIKTDLSVAGVRRSTLFPDLTNLAIELSEIVAFDEEEKDLDAETEA